MLITCEKIQAYCSASKLKTYEAYNFLFYLLQLSPPIHTHERTRNDSLTNYWTVLYTVYFLNLILQYTRSLSAKHSILCHLDSVLKVLFWQCPFYLYPLQVNPHEHLQALLEGLEFGEGCNAFKDFYHCVGLGAWNHIPKNLCQEANHLFALHAKFDNLQILWTNKTLFPNIENDEKKNLKVYLLKGKAWFLLWNTHTHTHTHIYIYMRLWEKMSPSN